VAVEGRGADVGGSSFRRSDGGGEGRYERQGGVESVVLS